MAASAGNIACFALLVSILALQVPSFIDQQGTTSAGTTTTASPSAPPPLFDDGALKAAMLALAGMDAVLIAAAVIYNHHTHHAAGAGGGNWCISDLASFVLCLQVGVLQFVLFVQDPAARPGSCSSSSCAWHQCCPCFALRCLGHLLPGRHPHLCARAPRRRSGRRCCRWPRTGPGARHRQASCRYDARGCISLPDEHHPRLAVHQHQVTIEA